MLISEFDVDDLFDAINDEFVDSAGGASSGTGFVVSDSGHVLTNAHVVEECTSISFQIRGSKVLETALLSSNAVADLALLKIESFTGEPARFASTSLQLGEELVTYGFPLSEELSSQGNLTDGIVSALSGIDDDLTEFQMTAPIQPGNSGSPVLNRYGNVIGVATAVADQDYFLERDGTYTQNVNFSIHSAIAMRFLDINNVGYRTGEAAADQMSLSEISRLAQQFTGFLLCQH